MIVCTEQFVHRASLSHRFDEGIIRVKVVDDGRNEAPVFVNPSYVASIPEGVPLHYPVIVVTVRRELKSKTVQ